MSADIRPLVEQIIRKLDAKNALLQVEKEIYFVTLWMNNLNVPRTAKHLGVTAQTVRNKVKQFNISLIEMAYFKSQQRDISFQAKN